jgi:hypothetical protein
MKQKYIAQLRQEIVQVFGHPVLSISDCYILVEEVFRKTGLKISVNTLRRFFNLIAAKYPPSHNTLTILSKACGFHSYAEFVQVQEAKGNEVLLPNALLLKFIVSLFEQIQVVDNQDEVFKSIVRLTIQNLKLSPGLIDEFQKSVVRTKNGQNFYFEQFIHTDALVHHYGEGLRYYLNEKKDAEAQVFGHSLLCFRDWLVEDATSFQAHYQELLHYPLDNSLPPRLFAQYAAAKLFQTAMLGKDAEPVLEDVRHFMARSTYSKENFKVFPRFEYTIIAALVLTHQCEEALYYIQQVNKKRSRYVLPDAEMLLFKGLDLFHALALGGLNHTARAEALYAQLKTSSFYFLDQKYLALLLLLLERLLAKRSFDERRLQHLIETTGFQRFKSWIPACVEKESQA